MASIEERARFDYVRYANCWEDSRILNEALQPASDKRILSICSAGDNSLHLLASGAEVVSLPISDRPDTHTTVFTFQPGSTAVLPHVLHELAAPSTEATRASAEDLAPFFWPIFCGTAARSTSG